MSTIENIKVAIEGLSLSERGELEGWLHSRTDDAWDRQVVVDAQSGRLDEILEEADQAIDEGELRDLP